MESTLLVGDEGVMSVAMGVRLRVKVRTPEAHTIRGGGPTHGDVGE